MPHLSAKVVVKIALGITAFGLLTVVATADEFYPQRVLPSGGTIRIDSDNFPAWKPGTITYPASDVPEGTTVAPLGFAQAMPFLGIPPGAHVVLYEILLSVDLEDVKDEARPLFSTRSASYLTVTLPSSVDGTKSLGLFATGGRYRKERPEIPKNWSSRYAGTVNGFKATFTLPPLQFSGDHSSFVLAITQ